MTREEAIKTIMSATVWTDDEREALGVLIPELRESEDERIKKEIVDFLRFTLVDRGIKNGKEKADKWIAYLEKLKEQKPELPKPHKGDDTNPYDMSISEAQEYAINRGFGIPFNDGEVYVDGRHITQTIGNILRWADEHPKKKFWDITDNPHTTKWTEEMIDEKFEELVDKYHQQKPVEWNELTWKDIVTLESIINNVHYEFRNGIGQESFGKEVLERFRDTKDDAEVDACKQKPAESISQLTVQGKGVYKICPRCKERMIRDDSMVYTSMPPQYRYECPKCGEMEFDTVMYDSPVDECPKEQKPVVTHGETYHVDTLGTQQVIAGKMSQKPADIDEYKIIKKHITEDSLSSEVNKRLTECGWYVTDEKPAEWSEEDKRKLNRIYEILGYAADDKGFLTSKRIIGDKEAIELQDFLKSLLPQYHGDVTMTEAYKMGFEAGKESSWKPSEEQMEALEGAQLLYEHGLEREDKSAILKSLCEQLRNRM